MHYDKSIILDYYHRRDSDGTYEQDYGYGNPIAAAYWRMRDELVFEAVIKSTENAYGSLKVLEVGTGHGHELAKFTASGTPQSHLFGVDLIAERLLKAETLYPGIQFTQLDCTQLAFPDNSFDIVCQFTCIMHLASLEAQQRACDEMFRVLKPGGLLIWWDIAPTRWRNILARRLCETLAGGKTLRNTAGAFKQTLSELVRPSERNKMLAMAIPDHVSPISPERIMSMFPNGHTQASVAGLDYPVWNFLWKRSRMFAAALWRADFLGHNCFALVRK